MEQVQKEDGLKLLAAILMVIDHVGAVFFPEQIGWRIVGRLVFPIFAYYVAFGMCHTKNVKAYLMRIFFTGILTQPIYFLLFGEGWNILFTLFYGGLTLLFWESKNSYYKAFGAGLLLLAGVMPNQLSYGWYGVFTIFLFFQLGKNRWLCTLSQGILQILYMVQGGAWIQSFSLFALPLIYHKWSTPIRLPRYFFYVFYPAHLGVLLGIRYLISL
jgi:hypothetical protein